MRKIHSVLGMGAVHRYTDVYVYRVYTHNTYTLTRNHAAVDTHHFYFAIKSIGLIEYTVNKNLVLTTSRMD